jgi:hypothetical protein
MKKELLALSLLGLLSACGGGGSDESKVAVESRHCSVNNIYTRTSINGYDYYDFSVNECNNLVSLKERMLGTRPSNLFNVVSIDLSEHRYVSSRSGSSYYSSVYLKDKPVVLSYIYRVNAADIDITHKEFASYEYETVVHEESYYVYPDQAEYQTMKAASDPYLILEQLLEAIKEAPRP